MPAWTCSGDQCVFSLPLTASGQLAPGSYSLVVRSDATARGVVGPHGGCAGFSHGTYSAELLLVPLIPALPLPLAPLLGVALLGAARTARRTR